MMSHGKKRKNVEVGRVKGQRRVAQSEEFSDSKERRGVRADASSGQKEEIARRLVLVEWIDSYGCSANWQKLAIESVAPLVCRSVGWLIYDGEECKVVVPHLTDHNHPYISEQGCGDMMIPTRAVLRMTDLREPTPRRRGHGGAPASARRVTGSFMAVPNC